MRKGIWISIPQYSVDGFTGRYALVQVASDNGGEWAQVYGAKAYIDNLAKTLNAARGLTNPRP